jgi:tetratricopeptide (TPR) repeat protein
MRARTAIAVGACCILAACAATPVSRRAPLTRAELLSGPPSLASHAIAAVPTERQIVGLDEDMRRFVAAQVDGIWDPHERFRKLLRGMQAQGLFSLQYSDTATRTARATFHGKQGNCLSFTMLFVALAREAGLHAAYQLVAVPPTWSADTGVLISHTHVNARVDMSGGKDYIVDFNQPATADAYPARRISDRHALALFYSNLGAEAFIDKDFGAAFSEFRKSIIVHSASSGTWANLGLLYTRLGDYAYAEGAYLQGLAVDPSDHSALANLTVLYQREGKQELAAAYRKKIRYYEQRNPYYHYVFAERAYSGRRYGEALVALDKAIRLKSDEGRFYELRGRIYSALGRDDEAADNFARAQRLLHPGAPPASKIPAVPRSLPPSDAFIGRPSGRRPSHDYVVGGTRF